MNKHRDILALVEVTCRKFAHGREDQMLISTTIAEEFGELATEIQINTGKKHQPHGKDGVVGESIDLLINVLDMIFTELGSLDPDIIYPILDKKLQKWESKYLLPSDK